MTGSPPIPNAGVRLPPPALYAAGVLLGWAIDRYLHRMPITERTRVLETCGIMLVLIGLAFMASGAIAFRRARTAIIPYLPASRLVTDGPYALSRNPMYTGLAVAYLGASALLNSVWPVLLLPVVLFAMVRLVIGREEAYLQSAFGAEYNAYRDRVRRWI